MDDLRPSPAKRLMVGILAIGLLAAAAVFVVMLVRSDAPSPVCDHIAKLHQANPRDADKMVDALENYVLGHLRKTNLVTGRQRGTMVDGSTPGERCRSAMKQIEEASLESDLTKLVDCLSHVTTAPAARKCLGEDY